MKEIKDIWNMERCSPCSWVERINTVKITILPNAVYRLNAIPIKLPTAFFTELEKKNFTVRMETQKTLNSQRSLEKEWSWKNQSSWLQIILQPAVIKIVWYWHKNWKIGQWNKIESPEIRPFTYGHLIFDKGGKNIQRAKTASSINGAWKTR